MTDEKPRRVRRTAMCQECGKRRPLRKDGTVGEHETRPRVDGPCDGVGFEPIEGTVIE